LRALAKLFLNDILRRGVRHYVYHHDNGGQNSHAQRYQADLQQLVRHVYLVPWSNGDKTNNIVS
jgi:hypothetical protein